MLEQEMLREQFQALLQREQEAAKAYADLLAKAADASTRQQVEQLYIGKQRHVQLAERLLEIVD